MEESYAVHRRRKAAASARRREKTPEARQREDDVDEDEDAEAREARARMERMVEDTERMEALANEAPEKPNDEIDDNKVDPISEPKRTEADSFDDSKPGEIVANENRTESIRRVRDTSRRRAKQSQERFSTGGSSADDDKSSKSEAERHERKREKRPRRLRKESSRRNDSNDVTRSGKYSEPVAPPRLGKSHGETASETSSHRKHHSEEYNKVKGSKSTSEETIRSRSRRSSCSEDRQGDVGQKTKESLDRNSRDVKQITPPGVGRSRGDETASPDSKHHSEEFNKVKGSKSTSEETIRSRSRRSSRSEDRQGDGQKTRESLHRDEESGAAHRNDSIPSRGVKQTIPLGNDSLMHDLPPGGGRSHGDETASSHRKHHSEECNKVKGSKSTSEETIRSRSRRSSCSEDRQGDVGQKTRESLHRDEETGAAHRNDSIPSRGVKQIIPLSNESLMHDLEIAQQQYERREIGILDADVEDYVSPKMEAALRRRKRHRSKIEAADMSSVEGDVGDVKDVEDVKGVKGSWLWSWLTCFRAQKEKVDGPADNVTGAEPVEKKVEESRGQEVKGKPRFLEYVRISSDLRAQFSIYVAQNPRETEVLRRHRNRCIAELILMIIYCGLGAFVFRFTEGAFEQFYKCGVKRVKRDFLDSLWNYSHNLKEDDWKSMARRKLKEFEEQLYEAYDAGLHTYSGQKTWSFLNAFVYCLTVVTTIGYGHIYPTTSTGQAMTIIYAIFGIPMFLIILADFGKLFTRGMKFLWAFVRRVYYTGSCRRVRRTAPVQEVMKGVQLVYDFATFRRPSQMNPEEIEEMNRQAVPQTTINLDGNAPLPQPDTPGTPAFSAFEIDDEFNLPISVAITLLLAYIFVGATAYNIWEDWNFFQSFYFVFISMSTIGFGDFVPKHPIYMMCSIVYLVFGLALTSMCINVVQVMLSDSFKQASQKIGATIGFEVAVDDGSIQTTAPPPVEVADVHATIKEDDEYNEKKQAPKAKEEDVDL
ncbi:uncharacterized protein LOC107038414 isoform X2 [Diachasma alloeum]|uniref:uncharacterized protein LOC107038414 isoform X2 n=1 Tax=Diachasma alloeum TaxID=454923 RepID=UPI0007383BAF|nr:uncharacterized protein LOC107038414 isoform X2 [Diachasma alloeum]